MIATLKTDFAKYRCWVFDCDGVLLNSNAIKTQAFHDVASAYGKTFADELAAYHVSHGGVSRFIKFEYFFSDILRRSPEEGEMMHVLDHFSQTAKARLLTCDEAPRIHEVLETVAQTGPVYVVSGGMQGELREIFALRDLDRYFTAIFGSPDSKDTILARERTNGAMPDPALFIGDARYDFEVSTRFGLDFLFVSDWTEFKDWQNYIRGNSILTLKSIQELLVP